MTDALDLYRAAWLLIKSHGEDAPLMAAMRADELMAQGDMDGAATFKRIVRIITEIGRERRADEVVN